MPSVLSRLLDNGEIDNGEIDIATLQLKSLARESFDLEPVLGIVFGAYPSVCLLERTTLTNLLEHLHNLAGHIAEILAVLMGEFVHQDMGPT